MGHSDDTAPVTGRAATFREVWDLPEFRALYVGRMLSLVGDQVARVALAVAVYGNSGSPLLASVTFAVSFLPYLVAGPFLAALGDRFPRRHVMVTSDLLRAVLVALLALPGLPLAAMFVVLFVVVALASPFEASRAALLPEVLPGDRYVVGTSLGQIANQASQVAGYTVGGIVVAIIHPSGALLLDAVTFLFSAGLLQRWVRKGAPGSTSTGDRRSILSDVREGAVVIFRRPVLRAVVLLAWAAAAFSVVPEGLAVAYAHELGDGSRATGFLVASLPAGALVGNLVLGRFVRPDRRAAWMRPLAVLAVLPLVGTVFHVGLGGAIALWLLAGIGSALHLPAITMFIAHTPLTMRARAFGLVDAGMQSLQGLALVAGGAVAQWLAPSTTVALAGVAGTAAVAVVLFGWPDELRQRNVVLPSEPPEVRLPASSNDASTARA